MNDPQYVGGMKSGIAGFTTQDQIKERALVQADDHNQPHKNWMESMRSTFERSLTVSRDGIFNAGNTSTVSQFSFTDIECGDTRDEDGIFYDGPPDSDPLWDPVNSRLQNLVESAFYFIILDNFYQIALNNREIVGRLIDEVGGAQLAFAPSSELIGTDLGIYTPTQLNFAFLTPSANVTGHKFILQALSSDTPYIMAERSITIHRER